MPRATLRKLYCAGLREYCIVKRIPVNLLLLRAFDMSSFRTASLLAALAVISQVPSAVSQSASELTPGDFSPQLASLGGSLVFSGEPGTTAPPGAEAIGITLSGVRLDGGLAALAEANAAVEARLTRGRIAVSELFEATAALEQAYIDAGFVLTRVVLPQQVLRDGGVLRISVVNGFIERVDTAALPEAVRPRVDTLTTPLIDRAGLTLREIERSLLIAGDVSGVALSTALATGARPGGTILAVDAEYRTVTGFFGLDNYLDPDLGGPVYNAGVELNSILSFGETLYGRLSFVPDDLFEEFPAYRVLALGVVLPLNSDGLTLNVEATNSRTRSEISTPGGDFTVTSRFERQSVRLSYPFIRSRSRNLTGQLVLDHQLDEQRASGFDDALYRDEVTVLRLGGSGSLLTPDGSLTEGSLTFSHGIDAFGSRDPAPGDPVPLSRQGADPEFNKLNVALRHQRPLGEALSLTLSARAQASFGEPLLASEQFGIVGPGELSSFDSGAIRGDSGYVVRAELSRPFDVSLSGIDAVAAPYAFAAMGSVWQADATAAEADRTSARSYGFGVDLLVEGSSPFQSGSVRLELGRGEIDNDGMDDTRFSFSGTIRF